MRKAATVLALILFAAAPAAAQGRGRFDARSQGVPPGHMPPPGECRVWYDGRPPGHQPEPTTCREAERIAARDRYARVIYGGDAAGRDDVWRGRDDERRDRDRPRAIPRRAPSGYPYPDRYPSRDRYPYPDDRVPYPNRYPGGGGGYGYNSVPFDNGYKDGYEKGREDARDRDAFDPVRHERYRSGDRGYDRRYGSRESYKAIYRDGFKSGYEDGYGGSYAPERDQRRGSTRPRWWPF